MTLRLLSAYRATADDMAAGLDVGREYIRRNRERGTYRPPIDNVEGMSEEEKQQRAACAHIAFLHLTGIKSALVRDEWIGEPNGYLLDGRPYNVVHRARLDYALTTRADQTGKSGWVFVLMVCEWPWFQYRGWAWRDELVDSHFDNLWNPKKRWDPQYDEAWLYKLEQARIARDLIYG